METSETPVQKKKSNGQLFKERNGYSKTMKRLMIKHDTDLNGIRAKRKARKKAAKVASQEKHRANRAARIGRPKKIKVKGQKSKKK